MLLRRDGERTIAIGQAAHARVSGQLAQAWGNERFGAVEPREAVVLAAAQHDIGMVAWDAAPDRNPATGLPYGFTEMPLDTHLGLWERAPALALQQSRYVALLVSLHGVALYEMRDLDRLAPAQAARVRAYFAEQRALQERLRASLGADATEVRRNQRLLWTWDYLSLALCLGWAPGTAKGVPTAGDDAVDVELRPAAAESRPADPPTAGAAAVATLDPWPFATERVELECDGRVLEGPAASDAELHAALAAAPWVTLTFTLLHSAAR